MATYEVFQAHKDADAVIHFAALKAVGESVAKPVDYYKNNLFGLLNVLDSMQKNDITNIVFSSSATVYGEADILPITESLPTKPALSPYGNTKKIGEDIIKDTAKADSNFNAISLRYFNPIGAHESAEIGESPNGVPNNLMPFITQTAVGLRKELLVFGNDYDTIDGTAVRDYIHVVDLAAAHVKAVERLVGKGQNKNYEIFNLGTGKGSSVLEVIQSFERTSGKKLPYRIVERRAGDIPVMYASTDLANQELDWTAQLTLDDMTASSWKWESKIRGIK
jgi:UDP-glucose 4-epimerase